MFVKKSLVLRYGLLALFCGVAVLSVASQSHAVVLRAENFDSYADGSLLLAGDPKWVNHSGTLFDQQVVSNAAELLMDGSRSEDLHMFWNPAAAGAGDIYFGLDFSVDADPNAVFNGDGEYFVHFKDEGFNFNTRVDIVGATGAGDFSVGIGSDDSTADAVWPTDLTFNTTYKLVARYNQTDNQAEIWIDAWLESDPSILGDDKPDPGDTNSQIGLRQSFSDLGETITVDNIVVATTFAEAHSGVPEPASVVLMLFGLAGLATRRRM